MSKTAERKRALSCRKRLRRLDVLCVFANSSYPVLDVNRGDVLYLIKSTWTTQKQTRMVQMKWEETGKNNRYERKSTTKMRNYNVCNIVCVRSRMLLANPFKRHVIVFQLELDFSLVLFSIQFLSLNHSSPAHIASVLSVFGFISFFTFFALSLLLLRTETSYKFSANKENSPSFQLVVLLSALNFHPFIYLFSYSFSFFCRYFGFIANEVLMYGKAWSRALSSQTFCRVNKLSMFEELRKYHDTLLQCIWSKCRNSSTELLSVMYNSSLANLKKTKTFPKLPFSSCLFSSNDNSDHGYAIRSFRTKCCIAVNSNGFYLSIFLSKPLCTRHTLISITSCQGNPDLFRFFPLTLFIWRHHPKECENKKKKQ